MAIPGGRARWGADCRIRSFLSHSLLEREGVRAPGALGIWDKGAAQHSHPIT